MIEILNVQDKNGYELMNGNYDVLAKLPDNCTNGDVIKALFGEPALEGRTGLIYDFKRRNGKRMFTTYFDNEWWNAPYKAGRKE